MILLAYIEALKGLFVLRSNYGEWSCVAKLLITWEIGVVFSDCSEKCEKVVFSIVA